MTYSHETILSVDLKKLEENYNFLKSKAQKKTNIIAVIKAYAYGHGDIKIAKKLEKIGVSAFWVADFEEGVELRKSGIRTPIIVANSGRKSYTHFIQNQLEPVIFNFDILSIFIKNKNKIPIHIKFNTGMNRYGFEQSDIIKLCQLLKNNTHLKVKSICSHLAASDNPKYDDFTRKQFTLFEKICNAFYEKSGLNTPKHILNTAGLLRFPDKCYDFVRIGIGLYGVSEDKNLKPISSLKSIVADIKNIEKGQVIGYGGSCIKTNIKTAVVPFGYADGLNRKLAKHKGFVLIKNKLCQIISISMDSCIVDISNSKIQVGDTVEIFSDKLSIISIAKKLDTIPYELLSILNRRIKRIYCV